MANKKKSREKQGRLNKFRQEIAKKVLGRQKKKVAQGVVGQLQTQSTSSQVAFLRSALDSGKLAPEKLRKALVNKAPGEMAKGAKRINPKGSKPTVDELMKDIRKDGEFMALASRVGLDEEYFINLAKNECRKWSD
ncbi:hypothetical protein LCGC14_2799430 [marine sediment metagenome]|uniref:Uncharacterized protein n=1 Tax=marine sediment metagenome TaxID=412755 RepID=A0A0F8YN38_9ZZZZ